MLPSCLQLRIGRRPLLPAGGARSPLCPRLAPGASVQVEGGPVRDEPSLLGTRTLPRAVPVEQVGFAVPLSGSEAWPFPH